MQDLKPGQIAWIDLTIDDAESTRDFYRAVVGWGAEPVEMDGYEDYSMTLPGNGVPVSGICHARGVNASLPSQWLMYVVVDDVAASAAKCVEHGGKVLTEPRRMGTWTFCVIQDPAGAVAALCSVSAG